MTVESDTEWLRARLTSETFQMQYSQKWIAVRDGEVVHSTPNREDLWAWLELEDADGRCVLAFADSRPIV